MRALTIPELAALPADKRAETAYGQYLRRCIQLGFVGKEHANWQRRQEFIAGWNIATEVMAYMHMAQNCRAAEQAAIPDRL